MLIKYDYWDRKRDQKNKQKKRNRSVKEENV